MGKASLEPLPKSSSLLTWIWSSFLKTALIPLLLVELGFLIIFFSANAWVKHQNLAALSQTVEQDIQRLTKREAMVIQERMSRIQYATEVYKRQTAAALLAPATLSSEDASRLNTTREGAIYSVANRPDKSGSAFFYSAIKPIGAAQRQKMARLATLQPLMRDLQVSDPLIAAVYMNTFDSFNILFPYMNAEAQYPPKMDIPSFNFYYEADAAHNPSRKVRWTNVYIDPAGNGWMASCIAPVYQGDFLEGVVGVDVTVAAIIQHTLQLSIPWSGYGMLVDGSGVIMALPPAGERDWGLSELTRYHYDDFIRSDTFKPDRFNLALRSDPLIKRALKELEGGGPITLAGQKRALAWATVPSTGWKLLVLVPEDDVFAGVRALSITLQRIGYLMIAGLLVFYLIFFGMLYQRSRRMSQTVATPLLEVNDMVRRIGEGAYYQPEPQFNVRELQETGLQLVRMGQVLGDSDRHLRNMQATVEEREADLQALVRSLDDVVLRVDAEGRIQNAWSSSPQNATHPGAESVGSLITQALPGPGENLLSAVISVLRAGSPTTIEYPLTLGDESRWFLARLSPIFAGEARPPMVSVLARDITARKQLEVSLIQAKEEAESASRAKSDFLSRMSHELRTPLNAILGFSQLLASDPLEPLLAGQRANNDEILKAGRHLLELINEVLDLSRIEAGRLVVSLEPVQASLVIQESLSMIQVQADAAGIQLHWEASDEGAGWVRADRMRLRQVLINLLANGVKYNRPGGSLTVRCSVLESGWVRIAVTDTGIGIPSAQLCRIFEPFQRVQDDAAVEGTGIGLAVARQLVDLMGGRLGVESEVRVGSTFWLELPEEPKLDVSGSAPLKDQAEALARTAPSIARRKVLYIEDNPANLSLIRQLIARYPGLDLLTAGSAEEGLVRALEVLPDLILLDLGLPGADGLVLLRSMRGHDILEKVPVIVISAWAAQTHAEKALRAGARQFLAKPVDLAELEMALSSALNFNVNTGATSPRLPDTVGKA